MTTQPAAGTTETAAANAAELTPVGGWSRRVRRIGGFIQTAFAALWLARASLAIGGRAGDALAAASALAVTGVLAYAIKATTGTAPRPHGPQASPIEWSVTAAAVIELAAAFVLPVIVIAAGHPDWVLPSIVITIGPLLLWPELNSWPGPPRTREKWTRTTRGTGDLAVAWVHQDLVMGK